MSSSSYKTIARFESADVSKWIVFVIMAGLVAGSMGSPLQSSDSVSIFGLISNHSNLLGFGELPLGPKSSQLANRMLNLLENELKKVAGSSTSDDLPAIDYQESSTEPSLPLPQSADMLSNNNNNNETTFIYMERPIDMTDPFHSNQDFMTIVLTHAITFIVGVIGNSVVIATWARGGKIRSPTATFLVSLACADLLLLIIFMPLETLEYFVITWDRYGYICKMSSFVEMLSGMASVLNLVAVSVERFLVIVYPIRARRWCTVTKSRRSLFFVWFLAVIFAAPPVFNKSTYSITYHNNESSITAYYCFEKSDSLAITFAVYELMVLFVIPALLMIICYCRVIRELWTSTRVITILTSSTNAYSHTTVTARAASASAPSTTAITNCATTNSNNNNLRLNQDGRSYLVRWPTKKLMSISVNCGAGGGGGGTAGESVVSNSSTSSGVVPIPSNGSMPGTNGALGLGSTISERSTSTSTSQGQSQSKIPSDLANQDPESPISCHHHHHYKCSSAQVPNSEPGHCWCKMFYCLRNLRAFFYLNSLFYGNKNRTQNQAQTKLKPNCSVGGAIPGTNSIGNTALAGTSTSCVSSSNHRHQNHHRCHHKQQSNTTTTTTTTNNNIHRFNRHQMPPPPNYLFSNSNCDNIKLASSNATSTVASTTKSFNSSPVPNTSATTAICQNVASLCCFAHLCCPSRFFDSNLELGPDSSYRHRNQTAPPPPPTPATIPRDPFSSSIISHYQLELDRNNVIRTSVAVATTTPIDPEPSSAPSHTNNNELGLELTMSRPTLGIINLSIDANSAGTNNSNSLNQAPIVVTPSTPFSNQYARRPITDVRNARKQLYCQVIKMLLFIVILFHVCWGPRLIFNVIKSTGIGNFNKSAYTARVYFTLLSFIHSALNPFVYGFMSSNFRRMMLNSCNHHHYHHRYHHHHRHHHSNYRYPYSQNNNQNNNNSQLFTPSQVNNNSMTDTGTGVKSMIVNGKFTRNKGGHVATSNSHYNPHSTSSTTGSFHRSHSIVSSDNERSLVVYETAGSANPVESSPMTTVSIEKQQFSTDSSNQFQQIENELNEALFNQRKLQIQQQQQQQSRRQSYGKNLKKFLNFRNYGVQRRQSSSLSRSLSMNQMASDKPVQNHSINSNDHQSKPLSPSAAPSTIANGHLNNVRRFMRSAVGGRHFSSNQTTTSNGKSKTTKNNYWTTNDYEHSC